MNLRNSSLGLLLFLAACNGSNSSTPPDNVAEDNTFTDVTAVQAQIADVAAQIGVRQDDLADVEQGLATTSKAGEANQADIAAAADKWIVTAGALIKTGQDEAAVNALKQAGLVNPGSKDAELRQAAALLTAAKLPEEAYLLFAPDDYVLNDQTNYSSARSGSLAIPVDETPSVKRHSMTLGRKTFWYTASAGHLTAFAKNPQKENPQASIFYTAYTRDDLPKEDRPVTFFFNGGPGASSIYLHMASFAPKRVFVDGPKVPVEWIKGPPQHFPVIDNTESLIDKSDLVFVDPVGTGYSQAIAPKINENFWGVKVDVATARDFIVRYVNANKRQASPKYLYGESYGGGIRVPKLARALEEAGTGGYETDHSAAKPKVLTGAVFHSPYFDYGASTTDGNFPTFALIADYLKKSTARGEMPLDEYAEKLRKFTSEKYLPARTPIDIYAYTGLPRGEYLPRSFGEYAATLKPGYTFNNYDGRM
ncbi:MAG TPA: hypothetical protein VK602_15345, partial [Phyllobacterium sp.]|nr:hypothetical protein [Phyllobacterium sp.]